MRSLFKPNNNTNFLSIAFLIFAVALAIFLSFGVKITGEVRLADESEFGRFFGSILILSLIVERLLEALVPDIDHSKKDKLKNEVLLRENLLNSDNDTIRNEYMKARNITSEKLTEETVTRKETLANLKQKRFQRISFLAIGIGILISLTGIRTINILYSLEGAGGWQENYFALVDIVLTGVVIGGGSDLVHQITKLANSKK